MNSEFRSKFEINYKNKNYCYDLGSSNEAKEAYKRLGIYKTTSQYGDLRRIFANLSWTVSEENPLNKNACLATHILALSVFPTLNEYKKLFVANSVTSIYAKANYPIPADWLKAQNKYGNRIIKNFNEEEALLAGLACIDVKTGLMNIPSIPAYYS